MDTKLLKSADDFETWKANLPANEDLGNDNPDSYPCIVAWSIYDRPTSSWWGVNYEFIYPSDFEN